MADIIDMEGTTTCCGHAPIRFIKIVLPIGGTADCTCELVSGETIELSGIIHDGHITFVTFCDDSPVVMPAWTYLPPPLPCEEVVCAVDRAFGCWSFHRELRPVRSRIPFVNERTRSQTSLPHRHMRHLMAPNCRGGLR